MRKNENKANIEGRLYEMKLEEKTVQNTKSANYGKPFIGGYISVATDEEGLNVLTVHYTFVTPTYKSGKANKTYTILKKLITEGKTWIDNGKDEATKVQCNANLALNDWWSAEENEFKSTLQNRDGFINIVKTLNEKEDERKSFVVDMFISNAIVVEENEEKGTPMYVNLRGCIFDFRNAVMPVTFKCYDPNGIKYFEDYDISPSNPLYTKCTGIIVNQTITETITEEAAFGGSIVKEVPKKNKDYIITRVAKLPYDFGEENVLTAEDLQKAKQDREVYLATKKKDSEEYAARKAADDNGFNVANNTAAPVFGTNSNMPLF